MCDSSYSPFPKYVQQGRDGAKKSAQHITLVLEGCEPRFEIQDYISRRLRFFEGPEGITLELVQWGDSKKPG